MPAGGNGTGCATNPVGTAVPAVEIQASANQTKEDQLPEGALPGAQAWAAMEGRTVEQIRMTTAGGKAKQAELLEISD